MHARSPQSAKQVESFRARCSIPGIIQIEQQDVNNNRLGITASYQFQISDRTLLTLDGAVKRLEPGGRLWVATAMRKVQGPRVAAAHRLEAGDLDKAFAKTDLHREGEARISAWHVAYGFSRGGKP